MIKSPICDILGIKYPLFQGGMAWIADAKLAAAVSITEQRLSGLKSGNVVNLPTNLSA